MKNISLTMPNYVRWLLMVLLVFILLTVPRSLGSKDKVDEELLKVLETADPADMIRVIITFHNKPTEEQLKTLREEHGMDIARVYRIIHGLAGMIRAGEVLKVAEYEWVKEIWLDRKVYTMPDKTVKASELIETLQKENDKLRQTISNLNREVNELQKQIKAQQSQIAQLETNLKVYSATTFVIGLIAGIVAAILVKRRLAS